jgi:predicted MFS family arabinose efflux permease
VSNTRALVLSLGVAQTIAWGSSFYLPAVLAAPMAASLGVSRSQIYLLLSLALLLSALLAPWAGRYIDRHGGRRVLALGTGLFATGLLLLALAQQPWMLVLAWLVLGLAMGCGLYDAAFATLVQQLGSNARKAISGVTLIAGFASTVGWPLSALMASAWGWRGACLGWVALHVLVALPLYLWMPHGAASAPRAPKDTTTAANPPPVVPDITRLVQMGLLFALWSCVSASVATHLPTLLQAGGVPLAGAVALAALAGPAQVAARLFELGVLSRGSPLLTARLAALGHSAGALCLLVLGPVAALPFVLLHGLGNGLLTIARGTLPLALFGPQSYGARQGWIALPGRLLGALSPWLMGLLLERFGVGALWLTTAMGLLALWLLMLLKLPRSAALA